MGGYGALKLALRFPEMFASAVSHSGALNFGHVAPGPERSEFARITGPKPQGGPNDLYALVEGIKREEMPALRIDCGTEDFLLDANRQFHTHLETLGVPHEYQEFPGAHDWAYWDLHVQQAIRFHARHLKIS
jgi:S-formylglutathione hydrolase FrmB